MNDSLVFKDAEDENALQASFPGYRFSETLNHSKSSPRWDKGHSGHVPCAWEKYASSYLNRFFDGRELMKVAQGVVRLLEQEELDFEAVAFRGVSGALVAPLVAALTGKEIIASRKGTDNSHSSHRAEGPKHKVRYLIVDDFISSGATCNEIVKSAAKLNSENRCVGIVEYNYLSFFEEDWRKQWHFVNAPDTEEHHAKLRVFRRIKVQSYELANRDDDLAMPRSQPDLKFSNGSVIQFKTTAFGITTRCVSERRGQ